MAFEDKRIAIVCDWLKDWGWAEQVLYDLLEVFPHADLYSSIFIADNFPDLANREVKTTFLDRIPFIRTRPKLVPFLRPYAFESLDLSGYDIVISSSSAESKGIITQPETLHICYCHSPTRYYWSHSHEYMKNPEFGIFNFIARLVMPYFFHRLRLWDLVASARVDSFIANSRNSANRIAKYYRRESTVITPGIDSERFQLETDKSDYYLALGRMIPYKKFDLLVDTFNASGKHLVIVTNTRNKLLATLMAKSKDNIEWKLGVPHSQKIKLFQKAKAFVFPADEDFGMVPIEAMLCGTPVIAYGKWGALETVRAWESGVFFEEQTVESLTQAIEHFESLKWSAYDIRKYAMKFDKRVFAERIINHISSLL